MISVVPFQDLNLESSGLMFNKGVLFIVLMMLSLISGTVVSAITYPDDSSQLSTTEKTEIEIHNTEPDINKRGCTDASQPQCIDAANCLISCSVCSHQYPAAPYDYLSSPNTSIILPLDSINLLYAFIISNSKNRPPKLSS